LSAESIGLVSCTTSIFDYSKNNVEKRAMK